MGFNSRKMEDQCHDAAEKDAGLGQNGYEMPPAGFRFNKTKTDYWRGRSEEARVFAESMGHNEPKAIMLRIAEEYEMIARWCEKQTGDRQCRKNLGQGAN